MTSPATPVSLSVVVIAYRNEGTVVGAVRSLLEQEAPEPFEIILVASGGGRDAALVAERFPEVRIVESSERLFPGGARNLGVEAARGEIVAFLAADCVAEPGWVAARIAAHRAGHRVVGSSVTNGSPRSASAWMSYYTLWHARLPGWPATTVPYPDPKAHGLSFDRGVLDALGPFDAWLRTGEDTDAARRLAELGIVVWYDPSIRTAHVGVRGLRANARDLFARGRRQARAGGPYARRLRPGTALAQLVARVLARLRYTVGVCWRYDCDRRVWLLPLAPLLALGAVAHVAGRTSERLRMAPWPSPPRGGIAARLARDRWLAATLLVAAAALYRLTTNPDWHFDVFRHAEFMERGDLGALVGPYHPLPYLVSLALFEALNAFGLRVASIDLLASFEAVAAGAAVALVFAAGRAMGGTALASGTAAAVFGASAGVWAAAGSRAGVYGTAVFTVALAWLAVAWHVRDPAPRRAAVAGGATGLAIGAHLFSAALAPGAVLIVALSGASGTRVRAVAAFAAGTAVASAAVLVVAAGVAEGWDASAMAAWISPSRYLERAAVLRRFTLGVEGLVRAIAGPEPRAGATLLGVPVRPVAGLIASGVLAVAVGRGTTMLFRARRVAALGAGLLAHAALAIAAAIVFNSARPDLFTLALVPLALLWSAGGPVLVPPTLRLAPKALVAVAVVVAALLAWNHATTVRPGLVVSRLRADAASSIVDHSPPGARLLVAPELAPRVSYTGLDASTGWAAILEAGEGTADEAVDAIVDAGAGRPVLVSAAAFRLSEQQEAFLGMTTEDLWAALEECCRPREVFSVTTESGREPFYVLRPAASPGRG